MTFRSATEENLRKKVGEQSRWPRSVAVPSVMPYNFGVTGILPGSSPATRRSALPGKKSIPTAWESEGAA